MGIHTSLRVQPSWQGGHAGAPVLPHQLLSPLGGEEGHNGVLQL